MVARRNLITGGLIAGLVGAVMAPPANAGTAASAPNAGGAADDNTETLKKIHDEMVRQAPTVGPVSSQSLGSIRYQQHSFLKSNGRYPEYIDVGLGPWEDVYGWHIKNQVPVKIGMRPDGFYSMPFYLTTILLKPNMQPDYVGPAYDGGR